MRDGDGPALLLVDKPEGPTSHDVVRAARRALGVKRIGHAGTLDPFASGLLLLCIGRATRLVEYFHLLSKWYLTTAVLGVETDTEDSTGVVTASSAGWRDVRLEDLERATAGMVGEQEQVPPIFSARKVNGRRAYEAARAGDTVTLAPKVITVLDFEIREIRIPEVDFAVHVSTGTYVRSLARDLGRSLSCGAHLTTLRRTSIGPFGVESATTLEDLEAAIIDDEAMIAPTRAVEWLPTRRLSSGEVSEVEHGRRIPSLPGAVDTGWPVALVDGGRLVAIARREGGELQPEKVFHD